MSNFVQVPPNIIGEKKSKQKLTKSKNIVEPINDILIDENEIEPQNNSDINKQNSFNTKYFVLIIILGESPTRPYIFRLSSYFNNNIFFTAVYSPALS